MFISSSMLVLQIHFLDRKRGRIGERRRIIVSVQAFIVRKLCPTHLQPLCCLTIVVVDDATEHLPTASGTSPDTGIVSCRDLLTHALMRSLG